MIVLLWGMMMTFRDGDELRDGDGGGGGGWGGGCCDSKDGDNDGVAFVLFYLASAVARCGLLGRHGVDS